MWHVGVSQPVLDQLLSLATQNSAIEISLKTKRESVQQKRRKMMQ
jgi:hypothetical protein